MEGLESLSGGMPGVISRQSPLPTPSIAILHTATREVYHKWELGHALRLLQPSHTFPLQPTEALTLPPWL